MDSTAVILFGLVATSLLLSIALAVAWRRFGRETHAALWSLAYGLSAANWTANLLKVWLLPASSDLTLLSVVCSIGSFALIAVGFRRRAGLPLRRGALFVATAVTVAFAILGVIRSPDSSVARALVVLFCSAMLAVSAWSLRQPRGTVKGEGRARGGAAFWMLALFAAYTLGLGVLALLTGTGASGTGWDFYLLMMLMGVPTGLFGVGLFAMFLLAADLAEALRRLAASDPLTGVLNRRGFEQAASALVAQAKRRERPLALVIADIDRFKAFNDRFGHALGDTVLQRFCEHANATIRAGDLFGRLGGEEFIFILPETEGASALQVVERIRTGLSAAVPELTSADGITASFGVAAIEGRFDTLEDMMRRADDALYRSKMEGRDRITLAASPRHFAPMPVSARMPVRAVG